MIMPNPERENKKTNLSPKRRIRITRKQAQFLDRILVRSYTVEAAMDELGIWPRLLDNWLRQPRFNEAIDFRLNQLQLQIRINAALFAPRAVRTLGYMFDTQADFETKRKASVDLLKIQDSLKKVNPNNTHVSNTRQCRSAKSIDSACVNSRASEAQRRGAPVVPGGAPEAPGGAPRARRGARKYTQNRIFSLESQKT